MRWMDGINTLLPGVLTEIVSGGARGVDRLGERWAKRQGISLRKFTADWAEYGKKAGILRNITMAEYADALIAFWDGRSRGTKHMISEAKRRGMPYWIVSVNTGEVEMHGVWEGEESV